ncbi:MAG: hypothetical protein AVDCRST_MAG18-1775 [uncultured Thermomicrobiales bacterium]|uniref:PRC-barrel domain-containing protein n=1 Tax=uncultured Thermomicrobiales bacterium TaxID=1645740 RepID=A0A6J4V7K8_9BACT|nr:MAG: hypothetical protein AVDCRST_MAG18-1775 [uncultured Thermomicrobiales bacterium]
MVAQPFGEGNELLARISTGMVVVDAAGEHVGTVRRVYLGATDLNEATLVDDPALDAVPDAVPDALLARLVVSGYVEIDAGPDRDDCYALAEQVAELAGSTVRLAVGRDTLAKK